MIERPYWSMRQIAAEAGISVPTAYHHWRRLRAAYPGFPGPGADIKQHHAAALIDFIQSRRQPNRAHRKRADVITT